MLAFAKTDKLFAKVLEVEKMYLSDDKMREFYRQNEEAYWRGVLATAKAEGIAKNLLEAARTMLSEGMDRLKVQHFTKLTDEEMARL